MTAHAPRPRDLRLDLLRGYFFLGMTIEHLPPHRLTALFRQTYGFISVAEGFVFVSGMVFALVYGKTLLRDGPRAMRKRAIARARDIYLNHGGLFTAVLVGGACAGHQFGGNVPGLWWRGVLLLYQPGLFFLLPMYFVFVLAGAFVLEQMAAGRAAWILALSVTLWAAAQFGLGVAPLAPSWYHPGAFNILAWQVLFFTGMYVGHRRLMGKTVLPRSRVLFTACVVIAAGLFLIRHDSSLLGAAAASWREQAMTSWKYRCHPLRMLNFAAIACLLAFVPSAMGERCTRSVPGRALAFVGRHSLPVFGWSLVLTYTATALQTHWAMLPGWMQTILAIAAGGSLLVPAWIHAELRRAPSRAPALRLASRAAAAGPTLSGV